jgi:hypothetical protein
MAAAPSLMDELLAAVMVPSFLKAGLRGDFVELDLARAFVHEITVSPARPADGDGRDFGGKCS